MPENKPKRKPEEAELQDQQDLPESGKSRLSQEEQPTPVDPRAQERGDRPFRSDPYANRGGDENDEEVILTNQIPGDETEQIDRLDESDADFVLVDTDTNEIEDEDLLDPEMEDDSLYVGTDEEAVVDDMARYTSDPDILDDFEERQETVAGSNQLLDKLKEHHSRTPETSADDIDADWESQYQSGEESVGGTTPTPDQDQVEELGEAVGVNYEDDEELDTYDKLVDRDLNRYEMQPESLDEYEEDLEELDYSNQVFSDGEEEVLDTEAHKPPMQASPEAKPEQLDLAREQGQAYVDAINYMTKKTAEQGGEKPAGEYIVGYAIEKAEGLYKWQDGQLAWTPPSDENTHVEISVRDAADNRFIPGLEVAVVVLDENGGTTGTYNLPFLWHPWIFHYGRNIKVPQKGKYDLQVHIDPPRFSRHDKDNGKRYEEPVEVTFTGVEMGQGQKKS